MAYFRVDDVAIKASARPAGAARGGAPARKPAVKGAIKAPVSTGVKRPAPVNGHARSNGFALDLAMGGADDRDDAFGMHNA